jgi:hypothetical protein
MQQSKTSSKEKVQSQQHHATTTMEEDVQRFRVIEDLQDAGINVSDIKKLQEAGLSTVGQVLQMCTRDLVAIKGLSEGLIKISFKAWTYVLQLNTINFSKS